jgi:hypothetical protein
MAFSLDYNNINFNSVNEPKESKIVKRKKEIYLGSLGSTATKEPSHVQVHFCLQTWWCTVFEIIKLSNNTGFNLNN